MKKFVQNKITIIVGCVLLVLVIGIVVWACKGCAEKEPEVLFSEEGITVEDMADDDLDVDEEKDATQGSIITAPDDWESGESTDDATEDKKEPEKQPVDEKEENEAETSTGFGKLF